MGDACGPSSSAHEHCPRTRSNVKFAVMKGSFDCLNAALFLASLYLADETQMQKRSVPGLFRHRKKNQTALSERYLPRGT